MRIELLLTLMLLALPVLTAAARAQNRAAMPIRFADMDTNNDRVISRREWRGSAASFTVHDWNGDGVLSRAEVRMRSWRPTRGAVPADLVNPDVTYVFGEWTVAGFHRLDHNSDRRISRDEWHFDGEAFTRADHNRDGSLDRTEFLGSSDPAHDDDREDSFVNLDDDRDGRVSRGEWHGGSARFKAMDMDGNGFLTREEATGTHETAPDLFTSVDVNRDGVLTSNEWHWTRASFDARDLNRDGRITRDEARAAGALPAAQQQAHRDGYERGYADGRLAGERDRLRGADFNFETRPEYIAADAGLQEGTNTRVAYQAGYRDGFRRGYREGYSPY